MNIDEIFNGFSDGLLIVTDQGTLVCANQYARLICHSLMQDTHHSAFVPKEVWQICRVVTELDHTTSCPEPISVLEGEFYAGHLNSIRVRTRWVQLNASDRPSLLVILEDKAQLTRQMAIAEAQNCGLTPRETQVWLLHRAGNSRSQIAAQLYISVETVKKHIKSTRAKRELAQWQQNDWLERSQSLKETWSDPDRQPLTAATGHSVSSLRHG
jgi:DNA-binding CsgD family transcriptional regulator